MKEFLLICPGAYPVRISAELDRNTFLSLIGDASPAVFDTGVAELVYSENLREPNRAFKDNLTGFTKFIIRGPFIICGKEFSALKKNLQIFYEDLFLYPEMFLDIMGELVSIPVMEMEA